MNNEIANTPRTRTTRMLRPVTAALLMVLAVLALAACDTQGPAPSATATPTVASTSTTAATPIPEVSASPTLPEATSTSVTVSTATPAQPTGIAEPAPTQDVRSNGNLLNNILGPVDAPEGWSVGPCQWGQAPFLCVSVGGEVVGAPQMNLYALATHDELAKMLSDAGLVTGAIDYRDAAQEAMIRAAFRVFVENYHKSFEEDRRITYGSSKTYTRLPTQEMKLGELPGVRYGFAMTNTDGSVHERWLSYAAFDGNRLFILVAAYFPDDAPGMFRSDAELTQLEPYLTRIAEGLKLPMPVLDVDVESVTALQDLNVFRAYTTVMDPIGQLPTGETRRVTGRSPDGLWLRIDCAPGTEGECWIEAGPDRIEPSAPRP